MTSSDDLEPLKVLTEDVFDGWVIRSGVVRLKDLKPLPGNPKKHSKLLRLLIEKWGFLDRILVNENTHHIIAGNGRHEDLTKQQKQGIEAPKGIYVDPTGDWWVQVDLMQLPVEEEMALASGHNRSQELGDYDQQKLEEALAKVPNHLTKYVGYDQELITALKAYYSGDKDEDSELDEEEGSTESGEGDSSKETLGDYVEKASSKAAVMPKGVKREDLTLLRYTILTSSAAKFRQALRKALEVGDTDDLSTAFELISNHYLDSNSLR
jgi:hypothetical protein